jgi:hypothetical protein
MQSKRTGSALYGSLLHNMQMNSRHGPFKSKMKRLKKKLQPLLPRIPLMLHSVSLVFF